MTTVSYDLNDYGFTTELRVRLSETDAVGIVFFGSFATYFDVGRMDYLAHLGLQNFDGVVRDLIPGVVVAQQVQFHSPATYNDTLALHVRIACIGSSSYTFHILATHKRTRARIASGSLTLVWLSEDFQPVVVPERFRAAIREFEGDSLQETAPG